MLLNPVFTSHSFFNYSVIILYWSCCDDCATQVCRDNDGDVQLRSESHVLCAGQQCHWSLARSRPLPFGRSCRSSDPRRAGILHTCMVCKHLQIRLSVSSSIEPGSMKPHQASNHLDWCFVVLIDVQAEAVCAVGFDYCTLWRDLLRVWVCRQHRPPD